MTPLVDGHQTKDIAMLTRMKACDEKKVLINDGKYLGINMVESNGYKC